MSVRSASRGVITDIYAVVRWHDDELADDFVILRTFTRRDDAEACSERYQEQEPERVFNVVVLQT